MSEQDSFADVALILTLVTIAPRLSRENRRLLQTEPLNGLFLDQQLTALRLLSMERKTTIIHRLYFLYS